MVLGTVLVLAALSLFLLNQWEDHRAEMSVEQILPQVIERIEADGDSSRDSEQTAAPEQYISDDSVMEEAEIDGYYYIGYLSIPSLGLDLPVMSEWDYTRLKIAPCHYFGSIGTGDLVIAAHNYTRHFRNLRKITTGDKVYFTDMKGQVCCYEVVVVEKLAPADVEKMTEGNYDLTLFTCTYGGESRVTVRCELMYKP